MALLGTIAFAEMSSPTIINTENKPFKKFYEELIYKVDRTPTENYLVSIYLTVKDYAEIIYKLKGNTLLTKEQNYHNQILTKFIQGIGRAIRDYNDKAVLYILDGRILKNKNINFKKAADLKAIEVDFFLLNSKYKKGILSNNKDEKIYNNNLYTLFFSYFIKKNYKEIYDLFELEKEDLSLINDALYKILDNEINIEKVMNKEYFDETIKTKSYKNIWILLLKIYTLGMKSKGVDIEKEIIQNNKYGYDNLIDVSKHIFNT